MSNMSFEKLWTTLSDYNIKLKTNIDANLICVICRNILIDPQMALCQCRFCRNCIEKYLDYNGQQFCPGSKSECKWECLIPNVNLSTDKVTYRKISVLIGVCPQQMCGFECELINMADHIQDCRNKPNLCPFYGMGCKSNFIPESKIKDHLNMNQELHSNLLVELINNLSNEVKRMEEQQKSMITEQIKKNDEIDLLKKYVSARFGEMNKQVKDENRAMLRMITKLQDENDNLKANLEKSNRLVDNLAVELKFAGMKLFGQTGFLLWKIEKLSEKRVKKSVVLSDYFYSYEGHKLSLYFYPFGISTHIKDEHFTIKLSMSNFQCNQSLSFSSSILVEIFDQATGEPVHEIKQTDTYIKKGQAGLPFNFIYSDLSFESVLKNDSIIIRCTLLYR